MKKRDTLNTQPGLPEREGGSDRDVRATGSVTALHKSYRTARNTFKSASMIGLSMTHEVLCSKREMLGPLRGTATCIVEKC